MIFVTVGHQEPFDRLIRTLDDWAGEFRREDIFAQIGRSNFRPRNFPFQPFLDSHDYDRYMKLADSIVSHAGTGTILQGLLLRKPLLVMPRLSRLRETRNDHQIGTARYFSDTGQILVAHDERHLPGKLRELDTFRPDASISDRAPEQLITAIRLFLRSG